MKRIIATLMLILAVLLLTSCGKDKEYSEDDYYFPTDEELILWSDDLLTNPEVIKDDELLYVGDLGIEKELENIQEPPNEYETKMLKQFDDGKNINFSPIHHHWSYPSLHRTFINPKIKPIYGSYTNNTVGKAWDYLGTPYVYGAGRTNDSAFDCSGFTYWVHLWTLGMELPKTSQSQWEYVKKFSNRVYDDLSQAKRGDLLFFMPYKGWQAKDYQGIDVKSQRVAHVGIYAGNGIIIHTASAKTGGVRFDTIKGSHLEYRFIGGGNVIQ